LPCTATLLPSRAMAWSSGVRQSTADHRAAGALLQLEQRSSVGAEVDHGHAGFFQILQDVARRGQDEFFVVRRGQGADPGVEELYRVGAGVHLRM